VHWRPRKPDRKRISQPDAFYLAQCNLVLCSVVKFGCSRGLVSRHLLGVLQPSVVLQVNGDPGCPPGVTSNGGEKAGRLGSLSNRSPGVVPVKNSSGYCCSSRIDAYSILDPRTIEIACDMFPWQESIPRICQSDNAVMHRQTTS
jgi:hypothetical protein